MKAWPGQRGKWNFSGTREQFWPDAHLEDTSDSNHVRWVKVTVLNNFILGLLLLLLHSLSNRPVVKRLLHVQLAPIDLPIPRGKNFGDCWHKDYLTGRMPFLSPNQRRRNAQWRKRK